MAGKAKTTEGNDLVTLDELVGMKAELSKELGMPLYFGSDEKLKLLKLPLGIVAIDNVLAGGLAFDRMTEIIGEFSSGKTLLAMLTMKAAQAQNLSCAYVDGEKTWTEDWARQLGIIPEKVLIVRPRTGEEAFNAAIALVKRKVGVLVIDSLASLRPAVELDQEEKELMQKNPIGRHAMLINRGLTDIRAENQGTLFIAINQLRSSVGITYGNPETLPGGKGQGFEAWQIIRVRRGSWIEEDGKRIGFKLRIRVEKSKQSEPFRECEVPWYFTGEIDEIAGLVDLGLEVGAIRQDRANYYISKVNPDTGELTEEKIYGKANLIEIVKSRPELQESINKALDSLEKIDI